MNAYENLYLRTADGIKPGLEVINSILDELDNPHLNFPIIHVAGTNGKGSVCAMIESVLRQSGMKTGLFTSPHLVYFSERYRINGISIPENKLNRLIISIEKYSDDVCRKKNLRRGTFFEISTAIAFQYFSEENVDIAIIETGMGGRWDATNVVDPLVSVITPISMDHTDYLGGTLEEIASEKAGIIKKGRPVISAAQHPKVHKVLALEQEPILISNEIINARYINFPEKIKFESTSQTFPPIKLPLLGKAQCENAALAISSLEVVADLFQVKLDFKKGLEQVKWPGRFMKISDNPLIIFDGAHNPDAASKLVKNIEDIYPNFTYGFILGFLNDKDIDGFAKQISSIADFVWTIPLDVHRGITDDTAATIIKSTGLSVNSGAVQDVWNNALKWANKKKNHLIVITGSLRLAEVFISEGIFSESLLTS